MASLKIFLIFVFAQCVLSDKILKRHCETESDDFETCVSEVAQDYFRKHSGGLPEHNLKAVDPIIIPEVVDDDHKLGVKSIYKNFKVTGFKDVTFSDFKTNPKDGRTQFNVNFDIFAEGDFTAEIPQGKSFSGTFKYEGNVKANVKYTFTQKKVNNEVVIYDVGPETITCEASNVKEVFDKELTDAFDKDPDTQAINAEFQKPGVAKEYNENIICKFATLVIHESVDVIRSIGKIGV